MRSCICVYIILIFVICDGSFSIWSQRSLRSPKEKVVNDISSEYSLGNQTDSVEILFEMPIRWAIPWTYFYLYKGGKITVKYETYQDPAYIADLDIKQSTIDSIFNYVNKLFIKKSMPVYASIKKIPYGRDYEGSPEVTVYIYRKGKFVTRNCLLQNVQDFRIVYYSDDFKRFYKLLHTIAMECSMKYGKDKDLPHRRARYDYYPKAVAIEPRTIQQKNE